MKTLERDDVIERLTESRIDTCMSDPFYLPDVLRDGVKGFSEMTDEELTQEYNYEFDEEITITK